MSLTEKGRGRRKSRGGGEGGAGHGFIPADRGRDMTPVGEETDYEGRDRGGGGAEMEERQREAGGKGGEGRLHKLVSGIHLH